MGLPWHLIKPHLAEIFATISVSPPCTLPRKQLLRVTQPLFQKSRGSLQLLCSGNLSVKTCWASASLRNFLIFVHASLAGMMADGLAYPWSGSYTCPSTLRSYNTCHKRLTQEPFVLNFLQISYIHSWHLRSHLNLPLSFPNVEPRVFWNSETTVLPKSTLLRKGKITQVFQDLWRVLSLRWEGVDG